MVQQSAEAQEAAIHSQMYKWIKTDRAEFSGLYAANMCEQVCLKKKLKALSHSWIRSTGRIHCLILLFSCFNLR